MTMLTSVPFATGSSYTHHPFLSAMSDRSERAEVRYFATRETRSQLALDMSDLDYLADPKSDDRIKVTRKPRDRSESPEPNHKQERFGTLRSAKISVNRSRRSILRAQPLAGGLVPASSLHILLPQHVLDIVVESLRLLDFPRTWCEIY